MADMLMTNILEDKGLTGFPQVLKMSIHAKVLEIQAHYRNWVDFEGRLLIRCIFNDSLRLSKKYFIDWVNNSSKGWNASTLLQEFDSRFARLSTLDQTMLDTSKVLLFVKSFDLLDCDNVALLLETKLGLTISYIAVKGVWSRNFKQQEWKDAGSSIVSLTRETRAELALARIEETRRWLE